MTNAFTADEFADYNLPTVVAKKLDRAARSLVRTGAPEFDAAFALCPAGTDRTEAQKCFQDGVDYHLSACEW